MGIFDTLKRKAAPEAKAASDGAQTSLQLLFAAPFSLISDEFERSVRAFDPTLRAAKVSIVDGGESSALGEISFGAHSIQVVVFGFPMPPEPVEACLQPAHFDPETKDLARTQKAHALLFYRGESKNVSEQYIALGLVAGALCGYGALAVLNETARTAMPARVFTGETGQHKAELSCPP